MNKKLLLGKPVTKSERFHQQTKLKFTKKPYRQEEWKKTHFKGYPRLEEIVLPKPQPLQNISLGEVFVKRRSMRTYGEKKLSSSALSTILYYSAGLQHNKMPQRANRFYPSAGARYPLETYIVSLNTTLPKGIYHYYLKSHSVEKLLSIDNFSVRDYFTSVWLAQASCIIILTAVFRRTTMEYGDRGYRSVLLEAGHLGQNFYLITTALQLSCCAVAGFFDDKLNALLDIDGIKETAIYTIAIGNR